MPDFSAPLPRVAIVGCGRIGRRRAAALAGATLAVCCDLDLSAAAEIARMYPGAEVSAQWRRAITRPDVDIVVVATPHDTLAAVAVGAAEAGKHVLIEKPGARCAAELDPVAAACARTGALVRIGFNNRFHPAFRKARAIFDTGVLGEMMFIRGRYGHGGRPGYDREWRADPARSGGGEMVDQGVHLIDLARWFLGDFTRLQGSIGTHFWNMPVEDNAFLLLETAAGQVAFLHASWTEWKNLFSFEIAGRYGKLEISGLGGSYGTERLIHYQMTPAMGPPETTIWEYPQPDDSMEMEFAAFLEDIRIGRTPEPGLADAQAALRVVEEMYQRSGKIGIYVPV